MRLIDKTGKVFDKLTVLSQAESTKLGHTRWNCICVCGAELVRLGSDLTKKHAQSCAKCAAEARKTHGMTRSRVYVLWTRLVQRATNPKCLDYTKFRYGEKGMDSRWEKFENFYADMGDPPSPRHSIDRIDNSKGYFKGNCRWATSKEQNRNKTNNKLITINGETKCLAEWCEIYEIEYLLAWRKLYYYKLPPEQVFKL